MGHFRTCPASHITSTTGAPTTLYPDNRWTSLQFLTLSEVYWVLTYRVSGSIFLILRACRLRGSDKALASGVHHFGGKHAHHLPPRIGVS